MTRQQMCLSFSLIVALCSAVVASANNLITDGASFEAGLDGCALAILQGWLHRECADVRLETDSTTAVDGGRSLKFTRPPKSWNRYGLFYKPVALRPGRAYTLSAYAKCAEDGGEFSLMLGGFPEQARKRPGLSGKPQMQICRLTKQWQRFELRVAALPESAPVDGREGFGLYYVGLLPGGAGTTFWIDAVQLEEGKAATPFSTGKAVELSLASNRPGNLFFPGETITPVAQVYAPKADGPLELSWRAVDLFGDQVAASQETISLTVDKHATVRLEPITVPCRAWLMIEVTASCGGHEEKEYLNVAVIEKLSPPLADQPCQFGFNYNHLTSPDDFGADAKWDASNQHLCLDRVFRLAQQSGVRWVRGADMFRWERHRDFGCEVEPGKFIFYDDTVKAIKNYGLEIMGTLGNANARENFCPEWARSGKESRLAPIPKLDLWQRYIRTLVSHYRHEIKHWEIINEPNTAFWAKDYLPLLQAAYVEAKAADSQCTVIGICATTDQSGDPYGYIRSVAEGGGLQQLDAVSVHTPCKGRPWQSRSEAMSWDYIADLGGMLKKLAPEKTLPIWNTEGIKYGSWTDRPNIPHATSDYAMMRHNRNMVLPQRLAAAYAMRDCIIEFCSGMRVLFLWEFRNTVQTANIAYAGALGMMDWFGYDGTPQAKFVALNALAEKLRGARPVEQFGLSPQVRCAVFDGPPGPFAIVWRENRDETDLVSYPLPVKARVEAQDIFGRPVGPAPVKISETPVYLVAGKDTTASALSAAVKEAGKQVRFTADKPLENKRVPARRLEKGKRK